jgi:hypothetical protein
MTAVAKKGARAAGNPVLDAADFLERILKRADDTRYGRQWALWINPEETKSKDYVATRDSIITDVVRTSGPYLPTLEEKRKPYRRQVGVLMPTIEAAARRWGVDDLNRQVPRPSQSATRRQAQGGGNGRGRGLCAPHRQGLCAPGPDPGRARRDRQRANFGDVVRW